MSEVKKKLLVVADAVAQTGFARVTHSVLDHLRHKWEVHVLGINYSGDPSPYQKQYDLYPASLGGDSWGKNRVAGLCRGIQPDVVLLINDPWNIPPYMEEIPTHIPVVAYMPVDAPNQRAGRALNSLTRGIAYTNFGRKELVLSGFTARCDVIPHGVDLAMYRPVPKAEAIAHLTLTQKVAEDSFIVGAVARNQPRKRLDLTMQYWTQWWVNAGQPRNAYLYLHTGNYDIGWDVLQLATYYGINKQFIITNPKMSPQHCIAEENMRYIYSAFDVQLHTSLGEGWGLTAHEGMACAVPQIMPKYAALGEWCAGAVRFVPVTSYQVTCNNINTIGGIADQKATVDAIDDLYRNPEKRQELSALGLARATETRFNWEVIAEQFHAVLLETVLERRALPVGVEAR